MSRAVGAAPPLSPLSMSSNDSSFVGHYGSLGGAATPATPHDPPYAGGPYGAARSAQQASPPSSSHPSGSTDFSRPSASGSSNRPPSSSSSIGMSSDGRMGFKPPNRDSSRSIATSNGAAEEAALTRHYTTLKHYLADILQDEKGNMKPNRARDKLLRLSATQFMELSTDVYDELIRREDERSQQVDNVPRSLLPKPNFHPKRNQARQKLSTLPTERFRQLATDVFYELERRIPRIAGNLSRPQSTTSNVSSRSRAPSRPGMRPPPGAYGGPPPPGMMGRGGPPPRMGPGGPMLHGPPGAPRRPSEAGSLGRPLPKHLQSNTIVPNKSTMVEDDDDMDDDDEAFELDHVSGGFAATVSSEEKEQLQAQEMEIAELKEKMQEMETQLKAQENELEKGGELEAERNQWTSLQEELERKHQEAQRLNESLQQELAELKSKSRDDEEIKDQHDRNLQDLHEQMDDLQEQLAVQHEENGKLQLQLRESAQDSAALEVLRAEMDHLRKQVHDRAEQSSSVEYERQIAQLREDLAKQETITTQVREEAMVYLREMRELSRQNDEAVEQEEKMAAKIAQLEKDNEIWRQRYAKIKAQNKHLRASTMGLGLHAGPDTGSFVRQEGLISEGGLVRDTDVTRFQVAVDELLKTARQQSTEAMLNSVKAVVISVQAITSAVRDEAYPSPAPSPVANQSSSGSSSSTGASVGKLKARVNGTANSLITATKQHAASHGLSPVALLDAAASNCTASVVELIKAVRIRPSDPSEFHDQDAMDDLHAFYTDDGALSPDEHGSLRLPVPQLGGGGAALHPSDSLPPAQKSPPDPSKKAGWFGWAGKWGDGGAPAPSNHHHQQQQQQQLSPDDHVLDSQPLSADGVGPAATPTVVTPSAGPHHAHQASIASSASDYDPYR